MLCRVFNIIFILNFYFCCKEKEKNILIEKFPDGVKSAEIPYLIKNNDTVINGTVKYFYHNGKLQDEFECIDGQKNGWYNQYDSLGGILSKAMYRNNKVNGHSFSYYNSGNIEIEELLKDDSLLMLKNYFPSGKLYSMSIYVSKKEVKYYIIFDSTGRKVDESGSYNSKDTLLN